MQFAETIFARTGAFFATLKSAAAAVGAIRVGRQPAAQDLERLGIDPAQFEAIRLA